MERHHDTVRIRLKQHRDAVRIRKAVLLALLFVILFSFGAAAKSARSCTPKQAAAWIRTLAGKSVYYWNPRSNAQCTELVCCYYRHFDATVPDTDAWQYSEAKPPSGWKKIPYYEGFAAQVGDVAVWTGGSYGHVALIVSADASSFLSLDQNMNGRHYAAFYRHSYAGEGALEFWGVIRPPFRKGKKDSHATSSGRKIRSCAYFYRGSSRNLAVGDIQIVTRRGRITCRCSVYLGDKLLDRKKYSVRCVVNRKNKTVTCCITGKGKYRKCRGKVRVPIS